MSSAAVVLDPAYQILLGVFIYIVGFSHGWIFKQAYLDSKQDKEE